MLTIRLLGIAYQLTEADPLVDNEQCQLDAKLMQSIGTNAIRVYHVEAQQDHSACMKTFANAGIYLWVDLDTFNTQIEQGAPHWNQSQLAAFEKVMDEFQQYDNTAGFFVGNEVITLGNGSVAAPYVKAAARDTKAYRDSKNYRKIPIGYSAADISSLRPMLQNYFACGTNESESLDFFSLNAYEWCGQSSYSVSGYNMLEKNATDYNIPIFLSETGCNKPPPRTFEDQASIFGTMSDHWSGAIIYEWIQEANNYGLVSYGAYVDPAKNTNAPPDGYPRSGTPTPVSPDFANLSKQWKTLSPSGVKASDYSPSLTPPPCPPLTSGVWEVNGEVNLPSLGQTFDAAVQSSITAGTAAATGASSSSKGGAGSPQITLAPEMKGGVAGLIGVAVGMALL